MAVLLAATAAPVPAQEGGQPPPEYEVKAAFLLNFAKLTEWPAASFETPASPVVICLLGSNPFGPALQRTLDQETAQGRPVVARVVAAASRPEGCHILFVPRERTPPSGALLSSRTGGIVTVGETERFLEQGGCIAFVLESGRLRFDVSTQAAERQGVRFSSRLLRMARRSDRPPGDGS